MKASLFFGIFVFIFSSLTFAAVHLDPNEVRPWNKKEKNQFPTPLAAVFKKEDFVFAFVGDHHEDPQATYNFTQSAINKISPQIIVVEGLAFSLGENPNEHLKNYEGKTKEEIWKDPSLGCGTELIAKAHNIPIVGGEPTIEEQMTSPFLLKKGYTPNDIRNVQILQRIIYRRDKLNVSDPEIFFEYAMKLYAVKESKQDFKTHFLSWYKNKSGKNFEYLKITKEESAVNCSLDDTFMQKVACDFNINRDRFLVEKINLLLGKYNRVMVVYGTGHFVQEYPAFLKGFGAPEYLK
jgi:hypothetical protein